MKQITIFIGLKIAEISSIVFIPYFIGVLDKNTVQWTFYDFGNVVFDLWVAGFMYLISLVIIACLVVLSYAVIQVNWKWAKKINSN